MEPAFNPADFRRRESKKKAENATFKLEKLYESETRRYGDRRIAMGCVIKEAERIQLFPVHMENGVFLGYRDQWGVKIVEDEFGKLTFAAESD